MSSEGCSKGFRFNPLNVIYALPRQFSQYYIIESLSGVTLELVI